MNTDYTDGNNTFPMLNSELNGISFLAILGNEVITTEFKFFNA